MKITDISSQKKNQDRVNIFLDGQFAFSLEAVDVLKFKLKIGMELTEKDVEKLSLESSFTKAMSKAMDIVSRKPVTQKELENKLFEKGYDELVVSVVINELSELGYINDHDYALLYIDYAREKCYGDKKIRYELSRKGVADNIINQVLSEKAKPEGEELAQMILAKYGRIDTKDIKNKQRIVRFFLSRGFGFDDANDAIKCYENMD